MNKNSNSAHLKDNMQKQKVDRNIFTLGLVSLFTDISSQMVYPLLPVFLSSVLGVGTVFIGLLEGIAESTASILKVFSGWFSDKLKKRKPIIFLGYGLSTIGKPFLYLATSGWHVLIVRFIDRVGVEYQKVSTDKFNTIEQADKLLKTGGKVYACGTCIKSREQESSEMCPISTMKDMYEIIRESEKVVTF